MGKGKYIAIVVVLVLILGGFLFYGKQPSRAPQTNDQTGTMTKSPVVASDNIDTIINTILSDNASDLPSSLESGAPLMQEDSAVNDFGGTFDGSQL